MEGSSFGSLKGSDSENMRWKAYLKYLTRFIISLRRSGLLQEKQNQGGNRDSSQSDGFSASD